MQTGSGQLCGAPRKTGCAPTILLHGLLHPALTFPLRSPCLGDQLRKNPTRQKIPCNFGPLVQQQQQSPEKPPNSDPHQFTGGKDMTSSAKTKDQIPGAAETMGGSVSSSRGWISPREANLRPKCNTRLSTLLDQSPNC